MSYDLSEHRHRFAVWAAARASQRGFTTIKYLRHAVEATDIREVLADSRTRELSVEEFDVLQRRWCSAICASLTAKKVKNVSYGRAAKLVAVYLKTLVIMDSAYDSSFGRNLHPPIDRILLQSLANSAIASPHKKEWKTINWTQLDEAGYWKLIGQLRNALPENAPFWAIEEYWQPSDSEDDM